MRHRKSLAVCCAAVAAVLLLGLAVTACGDDDGAAGDTTTTKDTSNLIRFTFAPDPVWDYLTDSGIRDEMEMAAGLRVLAAPTWDEFGIYAGGHADIISIGDMEVPLAVKESGRQAVVFGKYNLGKQIPVTSPDTGYVSICDVPQGEKIGIYTTVSGTVYWGLVARLECDRDFSSSSTEWEFVLADVTNVQQLAADGAVAMSLVVPEYSADLLMSGEIVQMYEGSMVYNVLPSLAGAPAYEGPLDNIFMAGADWYDGHVQEVETFLAIWQAGVDDYQADIGTIVASYPQHYAIEQGDSEQVEWMTDFLIEKNWFVTSVYLTPEWAEAAPTIYQLMRDNGFMAEDELDPRLEVITP